MCQLNQQINTTHNLALNSIDSYCIFFLESSILLSQTTWILTDFIPWLKIWLYAFPLEVQMSCLMQLSSLSCPVLGQSDPFLRGLLWSLANHLLSTELWRQHTTLCKRPGSGLTLPILQIFWGMKMTKQYKSYLDFNNWDTTFIAHFPRHTVLTKTAVACTFSKAVLASQLNKKKKVKIKGMTMSMYYFTEQ